MFKATYLDYESDPEIKGELATIHSAVDVSMQDGGSALGINLNESQGLGSPRGVNYLNLSQASNAKEPEREKLMKKYKRWNKLPNTAQLMTIKYLSRVASRELDPTVSAF